MMYPFFEMITILEPNGAIISLLVCYNQDDYVHNLKKREELGIYQFSVCIFCI